jgi:hypothetical protein
MDALLAKIAAAIERLWDDPVWSKVIATGVIALIAGIGTIFNWWRAGFWRVVSLLGRTHRLEPNIAVVNVRISTPDPNGPRWTYPLKCYVTLRNASTECADVRLSDYKPHTVSLRDLPLEVLQLRFRERWWPKPDGVDRIAVLPNQSFRAWIGLDETVLSEAQANELLSRGQIGTVVFSINDKPVSIELRR